MHGDGRAIARPNLPRVFENHHLSHVKGNELNVHDDSIVFWVGKGRNKLIFCGGELDDSCFRRERSGERGVL